MNGFFAALFLQAGYNTALVTVGAAVLGACAGAIGSFVLLRKRSLVSDAISHATLPGLALAFIAMALLTGDGRWMPGLMIGAAISAGLGLLIVDWLQRRTRLAEDAAIGAVLSVFFGAGVVLMTVVQVMPVGRQAGLSSYLLGSTAGMLRSEAQIIAIAAALTGIAIFLLRRPFTLVCFDPEYAQVRGINVRLTDLAMMGLLMAVTVIGLKVAGLVLIVALTITPPVAARFWTDRPGRMVVIAAVLGAMAAWLGAVVSSLDRGLPTGSLIVLFAFALFVLSLVFSPRRGLLAGVIHRLRFHGLVHERQGLLALARNQPIYDRDSLRRLRSRGFVRADGVATLEGRAAAADACRDEARWTLYRSLYPEEAAASMSQGIRPLAEVLSPDIIEDLDRRLGTAAGPREVAP
ncbi:manganese/zinc/iron transport system permease protein [Paracoccus alcaliphilus]|uniref:Manganese/zinc/iron transport system permease protein n=1 Tax=Paracoccus alcaliphilus TaxID=34002 RepID=A0A1H8L610_9RHOB|nr:metal ABC transporter permease [Paracoccus alcaliphilus]WCR19218.1 metal ABC transporter permease [Paracoccus alcaliphilus]SEO00567.1 manganese/zinc/iron transport system permease protein [Paracoccus alcaliphilus]